MTAMETQPQSDAGSGRSEQPLTNSRPEDMHPVGLFPSTFDAESVAGAVAPFLLSSRYTGETPSLPMIDLVFSKEKAIEAHMWGLVYDGWEPNGEAEGV